MTDLSDFRAEAFALSRCVSSLKTFSGLCAYRSTAVYARQWSLAWRSTIDEFGWPFDNSVIDRKMPDWFSHRFYFSPSSMHLDSPPVGLMQLSLYFDTICHVPHAVLADLRSWHYSFRWWPFFARLFEESLSSLTLES